MTATTYYQIPVWDLDRESHEMIPYTAKKRILLQGKYPQITIAPIFSYDQIVHLVTNSPYSHDTVAVMGLTKRQIAHPFVAQGDFQAN